MSVGKKHKEFTMSSKPACMTEKCDVTCSYAYSCHEQRVGRPRVTIWPLVGITLFVVIGLLL